MDWTARAREVADTLMRQLTIPPQGRWDADVVEFETRQMTTDEAAAFLARGIAALAAEAYQAGEHNAIRDALNEETGRRWGDEDSTRSIAYTVS